MAGLTPDGFVAKTFDEIEAGFIARQLATIDPTLDVSREGLIGQLNGLVASELAELWEVAEDLHDALDPDKASGEQQDALYALTNTLRKGNTKSSVVETVELGAGGSLDVGEAQISVVGNPAIKFVNVEAASGEGSHDIRFESVDPGPVLANAGTLTVIDSPVFGWLSATNAADAVPGRLVEGDPTFRLRRVQELAAQGGSSVPSLQADLRKLASVQVAYVIENTTSETVDGVPPKSFEAIVRSQPGADDDDVIAQTIWENKPAGIKPFGSTSVDVTDSEGVIHAVGFSRPTVVEIYVALRLTTTTGYPGDAAAKAAIVAAAEDPTTVGYLEVGADVYAGRLVAAAMMVAGVLNADARVSLASIPDFDAAPSSVEVDVRDVADLDTSRITISAFP